ncbi:30S ribosomal protein S13 [Candidatus Nanopusillus massiliensis]|nr:30S ribosomal protein S13 [Candidatus Nanopusillus massiliensis]
MDIKREIELKTWKGMRHTYRLPVRGQKTRSHHRKEFYFWCSKK